MADTSPYAAQADSIAASFAIPTSIFRSMIQTESGWNPQADASINDSNSHAYGLTQLQPAAALDVGVTDITDPIQQLQGGAAYLRQQYDKFGNWADALAAYNQGAGGVSNADGQAYAQKILGAAGFNSSPSASAASSTLGGGVLDFVGSKMANVGIVILGIGVVIVALFMSETVRKTAVKAAAA